MTATGITVTGRTAAIATATTIVTALLLATVIGRETGATLIMTATMIAGVIVLITMGRMATALMATDLTTMVGIAGVDRTAMATHDTATKPDRSATGTATTMASKTARPDTASVRPKTATTSTARMAITPAWAAKPN